MEMLDDDDDEGLYSDESVKYNIGNDKVDEKNRVVNEERSILLLATVSMTRLFTVDLVDGNKLELI